jgi:F-type H+-transporting ATPase subunit gamma
MKTIETVRRSIRTAEELLSVAKTMKAVAAANIRQYEAAVESLSVYTETVELAFQVAIRQDPRIARREETQEGELGVLVLGSDQGMVGRFNHEIVAHARKGLEGQGEVRALGAVGERVAVELQSEKLPVTTAFELPGSVQGVTSSVREIVFLLERWRSERDVRRVLLHLHRPLGGASHEPRTVKLLPMDSSWLRSLAAREWPTRNLPWIRSSPAEFLRALLRQYLLIWIHRAFAESIAAENASRLAAMQAAEQNVEERLEGLNKTYHRRRQASITEELLDVTAGFEVLRTDTRR